MRGFRNILGRPFRTTTGKLVKYHTGCLTTRCVWAWVAQKFNQCTSVTALGVLCVGAEKPVNTWVPLSPCSAIYYRPALGVCVDGGCVQEAPPTPPAEPGAFPECNNLCDAQAGAVYIQRGSESATMVESISEGLVGCDGAPNFADCRRYRYDCTYRSSYNIVEILDPVLCSMVRIVDQWSRSFEGSLRNWSCTGTPPNCPPGALDACPPGYCAERMGPDIVTVRRGSETYSALPGTPAVYSRTAFETGLDQCNCAGAVIQQNCSTADQNDTECRAVFEVCPAVPGTPVVSGGTTIADGFEITTSTVTLSGSETIPPHPDSCPGENTCQGRAYRNGPGFVKSGTYSSMTETRSSLHPCP